MRQAGNASGGPPAATRAWSAVIVVASITGGLLAAAVGSASWVTALGVSAVIGAGVAVLAIPLGWSARVSSRVPPGQEQRAPSPSRSSAAVGVPPEQVQRHDQPGGAPAPENGAGPDGVVRVMPLADEAPAGGAAWWQKTGSPTARHQPAAREPAAPLSSYLDSGVVVQCPRCGSFLVDVRQGSAEWDFGCQECGNRWTWRPGTPWPAVAVRPRLRGQTRPPPHRRDARP